MSHPMPWSILPIVCCISQTALAAGPGALARPGEAPDDGAGVHVIIGQQAAAAAECGFWAPRPAFAHVDIGLSALDAGPSVRQIPSFDAEASVCAADGPCEIARSGTVTFERVGDAGVTGTYHLMVGDREVQGAFDAPWCAEPVPPASHREAEPLGAVMLAGREHHSVSLLGRLQVSTSDVSLRSSGANGTGLALSMSPTTRAAVTRLAAERPDADVMVRGQLRKGVLHVSAVVLAP